MPGAEVEAAAGPNLVTMTPEAEAAVPQRNFFFVTCDNRVAGAPARLVRPWKKGAGGEW